MEAKKTLVLGASTNSNRYSYKAVHRLLSYDHEVVPFGIKKGEVGGIPIENEKRDFKGIHTVTLYLGPKNQKEYYDFVIGLNPERVIFNPGTYNPEFIDQLEENHIETLDACTLVMLSAGTF